MPLVYSRLMFPSWASEKKKGGGGAVKHICWLEIRSQTRLKPKPCLCPSQVSFRWTDCCFTAPSPGSELIFPALEDTRCHCFVCWSGVFTCGSLPEDSALLLSHCMEHCHSHCSNTPPVDLKKAEQSPKDLHYPPVFDRYSCVCAK